MFSPYKDVGINFDWNQNIISTSILGSLQPILDVFQGPALTWAFATGLWDVVIVAIISSSSSFSFFMYSPVSL